MINNTLKEYYIKLTEAWDNALKVLNAINQSLTTNSTEIPISVYNASSGNEVAYRIPSFLYLENKLETLSNNFDSLFNLPKSGEAWLSKSNNSSNFKLNMVRTGTAPIQPSMNNSSISVSYTVNNALKDLVSPKTFLRVKLDNLPENIEKLVLKKAIFHNSEFFSALYNRNLKTYDDYLTAVYTLRNGIDYEEYDSILEMPIKRERYNSAFSIEYIDPTGTYIDEATGDGHKYTYTITVDTLKYLDAEDPSIEFSLKPNDLLALGNTSTIFRVKSIVSSENKLIIEEHVGHYVLQNVEEDPSMILSIYNEDYSDFHYVDIPLEENPYLCLMVASIQNNVRSTFSRPMFINLNNIYITDAKGQFIFDSLGNKMSYMQYYNKNCTNIGDLIIAITQEAYPQLAEMSSYVLANIQEDTTIKELVSASIDPEVILNVVPINEHIINNDTVEEIISMHAQKNELSSRINTINESIETLNNKLLTTDFSQNLSTNQVSIKNDINDLYSEKLLLQKQLIAVVENINVSSAAIDGQELKYRIRGVTVVDELTNHLKNNFSQKIDLIGIDVEYKYKSINKSTSKLITINNNVFTDWNKYTSIDKERVLKSGANGSFYLVFDNYDNINNIIKWNQIDIPIASEEDVVIRIRYKYNVGQPFVNVYTPWSDEITVIFPSEYKENINVTTVIAENKNDIALAQFNKALITEGYAEHLNDGIIDGTKKFYHNASNIYSGFSTPENHLMSIKDKMDEMLSSIEKYQRMLDSELTQKYKIYLQYDDKSIELLPNVENNISVYNSDHIIGAFVKKKMNIVIKNVGEVPIKMYSIFPGGITTPLIMTTDVFYDRTIINYERVPLTVSGVPHYQMLGQWIYFRQNNPWTNKDIYYNSSSQRRYDWVASSTEGCHWDSVNSQQLMKRNNDQVMFGWRRRETGADTYYYGTTWKGMLFDKDDQNYEIKVGLEEAINSDTKGALNANTIAERYQNIPDDIRDTFFMYKNVKNNYLMKYEDIYYEEDGIKYYLDEKSNIVDFVNHHNIGGGFNNDTDFTGAFLYPDLDAITEILTDGSIGGFTEIPAGGSLSVPVSLEFFLNENLTSVKKSLNFDIKPSSFTDPSHYLITITSLYDYTASGNVIGDTSLVDESIDY